MGNNQQTMMPPPWFWQFMATQAPDQPQPPDVVVPARVNKAFEFINFMAHKTMQRIAINEFAIEVIDGQAMNADDECVYADACKLLSDYFRGKNEPDVWEQLKITDLARASREPNHAVMLKCPLCSELPSINKHCTACAGSGGIVAFPASMDQQG